MPVMLGGDKAYLTLVKGDLIVSFQWLDDQPAMFMWPKRPRIIGNRGAYCMPLNTMHQYVDPQYAAKQAIIAAEVMGMDVTKATLYRIMDVFHESIQELKDMPPKPLGLTKAQLQKAQNEEMGQMKVQVDGKVIREETVYVPTLDELASNNG